MAEVEGEQVGFSRKNMLTNDRSLQNISILFLYVSFLRHVGYSRCTVCAVYRIFKGSLF